MSHFVQGILTVEDDTYIAEPDIRLRNGKTIPVLYASLRSEEELSNHEEDDPLSLLLEKNKWFEILLIAQIGLGRREVTYFSEVPPGTRLELKALPSWSSPEEKKINWVVQGIILDVHWDASSVSCLAVAGQKVYTHPFVLVETAVGKMVLSYKALGKHLGERITQIAPGGYLEWGPARLDILAIIAKRDPLPGE